MHKKMSYGDKKMSYGTKPKTSGKTPTSGHDPAGKKTGATATKMGSTYDYRKGSQAKKPSVASKKASRNVARLAKKRANALKRAVKKKARLDKRAAKKDARTKKRGFLKR